jgi:isopenicillin-N N-acyltransferase-like protein
MPSLISRFRPRRFLALSLALLVLCTAATASAGSRTIARCGQGWLEEIDGQMVLHVAGTPYEMGYQHGVLLKDHVKANLNHLLDDQFKKVRLDLPGFQIGPENLVAGIIELQKPHIPAWYSEEIRGVAEGSGLPVGRVTRGNFVPELFHCSGFAVMGSATKDGVLYHGRVLDYATDWRLQEHAVLVVSKPDKGVPSVNVTFAGFVGSVTGMNAERVSIGEMGGRGLGHWNGVPMAVLVRWVLRDAKSLDEALAIFRDHPRTCQYYYVAADGKTNKAVGFEASWDTFRVVEPGEKIDLLPRPVKDSVLLSAGGRYNCLVDRVQAGHGKIDAPAAIKLMDRGVAMDSNLHNVLFAPASTRFWVSYAGIDKTPAAERPYQAFQLDELLKRQPSDSAPELSKR